MMPLYAATEAYFTIIAALRLTCSKTDSIKLVTMEYL